MKTHFLKTSSRHFVAVVEGNKTAELRCNDRGFLVGDLIVLQETDEETGSYTGRFASAQITHILPFSSCAGLAPDFVMLSFNRLTTTL